MGYDTNQKQSIVEESLNKLFGKLTVVEFAGYRKTPRNASVPMVKCKCECGNEKVVSLWDLRTKKTKTCGLNHPHYADRTKPAFNKLYGSVYKGRALKSNWEFSLTEERFRELTKRNCHYCDLIPSTCFKVKTGNSCSEYVYNGLDRKNNKIGYTNENVVPCCSVCNHAKHVMEYDKFIDWLDRITNFRNACNDRRPE